MLARLLILLIRLYQRGVSPFKRVLLGTRGCCRFYPTCSNYAIDAIRVHGAVAGGWLAVLRVLRCNPFFRGGFDPVPKRRSAIIWK